MPSYAVRKASCESIAPKLHLFAGKHEQHAAAGVFSAGELAAQHGADGNGGIAHVKYWRADPASQSSAPMFVVQHLASDAAVELARNAGMHIKANRCVRHPLVAIDKQARAGVRCNASRPLQV